MAYRNIFIVAYVLTFGRRHSDVLPIIAYFVWCLGHAPICSCTSLGNYSFATARGAKYPRASIWIIITTKHVQVLNSAALIERTRLLRDVGRTVVHQRVQEIGCRSIVLLCRHWTVPITNKLWALLVKRIRMHNPRYAHRYIFPIIEALDIYQREPLHMNPTPTSRIFRVDSRYIATLGNIVLRRYTAKSESRASLLGATDIRIGLYTLPWRVLFKLFSLYSAMDINGSRNDRKVIETIRNG